MDPPPRGTPSVATVFDAIADAYDASGVALFRPVGRRLVELLAPQPGDRALDAGCGKGAVTVPLADAVGPTGQVRAVDVAAEMVRHARAATADRPWVRVEVGDATEPDGATYDVVAASLVLFFVPDPVAGLRSWVDRLAPGGRVGLTTFGPRDDTMLALDALLAPYAPPGLLDARTSGASGPFANDDGVAGLLREAGAVDVRTVVEPVALHVPDVATWERFSRSTGQWAMWQRLPDTERDGVLARAAEVLTGEPLVWLVRYSIGAAP